MLRQSRAAVRIYGESGNGKQLVASALHSDDQFRSAPFIRLHCGAIAPELIESELFDHEQGAFTGAQQACDGLFRAADGGPVCLGEIRPVGGMRFSVIVPATCKPAFGPGGNDQREAGVGLEAAVAWSRAVLIAGWRMKGCAHHVGFCAEGAHRTEPGDRRQTSQRRIRYSTAPSQRFPPVARPCP